MSTTIDQRVVEMRFDNKHFESNVRETMSTLDKLKQKLNLNGAAKGLENINTSANKVNMNGLSNALGTVQARFSALEVMGVTALANITNSAVNAGKRIVSALTIEPIKSGFQEYETQINAVQTILSNTRSEGTNVEIVNKALDELNTYADKTIYNFTEMTKNIGTFTAAGVKLDTSVNAIKGIANLAAVSGSTSQQASTAMYQLSQALAAGKVSLMDWNSVVNAGMGGKVFQDALIRTSELLGTGANDAIKMYGSFRESLTKGEWLTTEVLTETLNQLSGAYSKADLIAQGFTEAQAEEIVALAKDAEDAATKVKTFTQLWDVLKESAQSGWSKTWRLIIGDFDDARNLLSPLATFLTGAIDKFSEARNKLLESALGKSFTGLLDKIKTSADGVKKVVDSVKDYGKIVDEIIGGKWGNGQARFDKLAEAGYDWAHAQNLVNEKLGSSVRHATNYKEAQNGVSKTQEKVNKSTSDYIVELTKLSDKELKAKGYTEEQIKAFRDLAKAADQTGIPLKDFIDNIDEIDGRWLLMNSFKNIGMSLVSVFKSIGKAWRDAFPPMSSDTLFNIIAGLHKFSATIRSKVEKNADKLTRTLKGLFAVIDMISMVVGGGFKIAFNILKAVLGAFNMDILEFTARIGDAIVKVRDWVEENNLLVKGIKFIAPYIKSAVDGIKKWITTNETITKGIAKFKTKLQEIRNSLSDWVKGLKETDNIPKYILEGLINGLKSGAGLAIDAIVNLGKGLIEAIKGILGIHSPSTEFYEIGKNIIQGLFNGISDFVKMIYTLVMSIGTKLTDIIKGLDLGSIFTIAVGAGSVYGFVKFAQAIEALTSPMEAFGDIAETFNKTLKKFNGVLSAFKFKLYADSLKSLAIAVAILAGSIIALTLVDPGKMWSAVGAIVVLAAVLGTLTAIAGKFGGSEGVEFGKIALTLLGLGISMALMAKALNTIAKIKPDQATQAIGGFVILMGSLIAMMAVVNKNKSGFVKLGSAFLGIAFALLMMTTVTKILGKMDRGQLIQGGLAIVAFSGIIIGLMAATKLLSGSKNVDKIANTIAKVGTAILMMGIVAKMLGSMDRAQLIQGGLAIVAFSGIIVGLMAATKLISGSTNVDKIGKAIFGISGALLMMVFVAKIAASMEPADLAKGTLAIAAFGGIIVGLMAATKLLTGSKNVDKIGKTLLTISVAIGLMGITATLLGLIDTKNLVKGIVAVGLLSAMVAGLIAVTHFAKNVKGTMIVITVAIGVLALAMAGLSMIDPSRLLGATAAIGVLMGMFALIVGVSGMATKSMGTLIVMTVAIGVLAGALYLIAQLPIEKSMAATIGLSTLLLALSGALVILSVVGSMGPAAFIGIGALATLIVGLTAVVIAIGALMEHFPALQSFLNAGLSALIQLAGGLGEMIGAFVNGVLTQIASGLPAIGANLSMFMVNLAPFIAGAKMIDGNVLAGVGILAASIIALTAASLIEGITSLLPFVGSFANLGTQLSAFIMNAMPFIMMSKLIDPAIMEGVKTLAEAILILTGANILEGISRLLGGEGSLDKFGSQLGGLGTSMNQFVSNLGTFDESKLMTVTCATKAIKSLAQAANEIPNEGGLWAKIVGENSIAAFGDKLPGLATSINGFITNLGTFDESKVTTVNCACDALKSLASAASEIPNEGGLWASIVGENSIATFGNKLPGLATSLNGFITNLGSFDESKIATVDCACKAIKSLASAANSIPNEGGLWAKIVGDNSLATFGSKLPGLAKNISGFVSNLGTFSEAQVTTVNSACKAIKSIAKLGEIDIKDTGSGLNSFGKNMVKFAKKVKEFVEQVGEVGAGGIDSAIKKTKELIKMATTVADTNISSIKTFGDSLKKFAKEGVKGFVKEFSGSTPKKQAKEAVKAMIDSAIDGAESKKSDVKKKFKSIAEAAADALSSQAIKTKAKSAGKDLVKGFASGISENTYLATAKAKAMANAAEKAARDALDINSPSRVFREIGSGIPEGFAQGITMLGSKIKNSVSTMSNTAISGTTKAISRIADSINMDIDTQPTIRPVLDLSDVESGAGYLNTMFNTNPSIGLMSNLNAISSGMNSLNQNGNGDVVSAIDKLRRDLGNTGGDTYNINGVSVDDDSNVRDAVQTIIRAAVIERRI
mgnify:CR=1 FL=1